MLEVLMGQIKKLTLRFVLNLISDLVIMLFSYIVRDVDSCLIHNHAFADADFHKLRPPIQKNLKIR